MSKDTRKILCCNAGPGLFIIPSDDIIKRDGMFIHARRLFSLEQMPSETNLLNPVSGKGIEMSLGLAPYNDVYLMCTFICTLSETSQVYIRVNEILDNEERGVKLL